MHPAIARTLYRLQERLLGRPTFARLKELEASQWWPRARIQALQLRRLQDLVRAAYEHTPYWREVMDERGIRPDGIGSLADLGRFPLLTKATIRARREDMVWRDGGGRVQMARTSGSTNEPLEFYTSSVREAQINAARIRGHEWVGIRRGDREMYFWGSPVEIHKQDRLKHVRDWLVNDGFTDGFGLRPERVAGCLETWQRFRPACLFSYPSSLALLVKFAGMQGRDVGAFRRRGLKCIVTTAEPLEPYRDLLGNAFGVPVHDSYGLREVGLIGHECCQGTMHATEEQLLLETVDPEMLEPTGGSGELVVTNLASWVMPMLRYRAGDMVTLSSEPCACGRMLRGVAVNGGRLVDFIVTSEGLWLAGYVFVYLAKHIPGIIKLQARQDRVGEVRLLLVTDDRFNGEEEAKARDILRARLQCDDTVHIERVDDIPVSPSGKHRMVISKVAEALRASGAAGPQDDGSADLTPRSKTEPPPQGRA